MHRKDVAQLQNCPFILPVTSLSVRVDECCIRITQGIYVCSVPISKSPLIGKEYDQDACDKADILLHIKKPRIQLSVPVRSTCTDLMTIYTALGNPPAICTYLNEQLQAALAPAW